jgi:hypothetical protein
MFHLRLLTFLLPDAVTSGIAAIACRFAVSPMCV